MSDFVLAVIAFVIVIGPLIFIHELGHFLAARLVGVTVLEFGIGFPPRAIKLFEQGGTEFTLNWLPIGGFVRPLGEDFVRPVGEAATDAERAVVERRQGERQAVEAGATPARPFKTKSLMEAGPWQRIFFMSAGMMMNIAAGIILFIIAALIGLPVQTAQMSVGNVGAGSFASTAGFLVGDVISSVNGKTVNSLGSLETGLCQRNGSDLSVTVTRAGQSMTLALPDPGTTGGVVLKSIQAGEPAAVAGFKANDRILKAGNQPICSNNDLYDYESTQFGKPVTFTFIRSGETAPQTLTATLNNQMPGLGVTIATPKDMATLYGLTKFIAKGAVYTNQSQPLGVAIQQGLSDAWGVLRTTIDVPVNLIKGTLSVQDARPASVVGISEMGAQVIQDSLDAKQSYPIWRFAAIISIAIGITQLLPIPGLDGGRILFVVIELLRGKPMKPEREGMIHLVGLMLLLGFMLIFMVNDLFNPISLNH